MEEGGGFGWLFVGWLDKKGLTQHLSYKRKKRHKRKINKSKPAPGGRSSWCRTAPTDSRPGRTWDLGFCWGVRVSGF